MKKGATVPEAATFKRVIKKRKTRATRKKKAYVPPALGVASVPSAWVIDPPKKQNWFRRFLVFLGLLRP